MSEQLYECPYCLRQVSVSAEQAGKIVECPTCKESFCISEPEPEIEEFTPVEDVWNQSEKKDHRVRNVTILFSMICFGMYGAVRTLIFVGPSIPAIPAVVLVYASFVATRLIISVSAHPALKTFWFFLASILITTLTVGIAWMFRYNIYIAP